MHRRTTTAVEAVKRARPLWPELTLSCDFEAETLPLLFSPDTDCDAYFDALEAMHHRKLRLIRHVRAFTLSARQHRADGDWAACVEALQKACVEREAIFAYDDYQCVAARVHLAWTAIHAASILAVSHDDDLLAAAHPMFILARSLIGYVFGPMTVRRESEKSPHQVKEAQAGRKWLQPRMNLVLHNNWANFWATRNRWGAAVQHATIASRLANTVFPHHANALSDALRVSLADLRSPDAAEVAAAPAEEVVDIPPPPADVFASADVSPSWENPNPLVMVVDARRQICEAVQRSSGTAALSNSDGEALLRQVQAVINSADNCPPTRDAEAALVIPALPSADADGALRSSRASNASQDAPAAAWTLLSSEAAELQWTLSTPGKQYASPLPSLRGTALAVSHITAAFLHLHLRRTRKALKHTENCEGMLNIGQAVTVPHVDDAYEKDADEVRPTGASSVQDDTRDATAKSPVDEPIAAAAPPTADNTVEDDSAAPVPPTKVAVPDDGTVPPEPKDAKDEGVEDGAKPAASPDEPAVADGKPRTADGRTDETVPPSATSNNDSAPAPPADHGRDAATTEDTPIALEAGARGEPTEEPTPQIDLSCTEWPALVRKLRRCVETATSVSRVEARMMPADATRQASGLTAAKLVRDEVLATKAARARKQTEKRWLEWAVVADDSGLLEDDAIDARRLRDAFQLPKSRAESRRAFAERDSASTVQPPFARATTPFGNARSRVALSPTVDLKAVVDTHLSKRAATPGPGASRGAAPGTQSWASGDAAGGNARASTADDPLPPPGSSMVEQKATQKKNPEAERRRQRQRELRAVLPSLDVHSTAYREVVRELSQLEATLREQREARQRARLLASADEIAARGGMSAQWRKTKVAKSRRPTNADASGATDVAPQVEPS